MSTPQQPDNLVAAREMIRSGAGNIHLVGICGVGMAGLAYLLKNRGFRVTGCDVSSGEIARWLEDRGIHVDFGHDSAHISDDLLCVVRTSAVAADSAELAAADAQGKPVFRRGEMLAALISDVNSIAVAGTHGKTTTASFAAQLLRTAGMGVSWCIGGDTEVLGGVAGTSADAGTDDADGGSVSGEDVIIVEADESDGTVSLYSPGIALLTSAEEDHMENFESHDAWMGCLKEFVGNAAAGVIYCLDDPGAREICEGMPNCSSYGFASTADVRAEDLVLDEDSSSFSISRGGERLGRFVVPVAGRHNALNALAAAALALHKGVAVDIIREGLSKLSLARRRFEYVVKNDDLMVISDYAHHPTEIKGLVATAMGQQRRRLVAVFQPHRYSRTRALAQEFPSAFRGVDELILLPVYAASERSCRGGTIWDLYSVFRGQQAEFRSLSPVLAASLDHAWGYLRQNAQSGDLILIVGAGDIERIAAWAALHYKTAGASEYRNSLSPPESLTSILSRNEGLSSKTMLGVGGSADLWCEVDTLSELKAVLQWSADSGVPLTVIGAGSNLLVSDLGVRGVVVRLTGEQFREVRIKDDIVVAGAGITLSGLLDWLEEKNLSGLEFLAGIPGTVGGALRTNAGAFGGAIGDRVAWVRCLDVSGTEAVIDAPRMAYRSGVASECIVEVGLNVEKGAADDIRRRRADLRGRRAWMRGLRCAGSVFKNPRDDYAGRLLEEAGMKGVTVGKALISAAHANVIVTEKGACASDVKCLMELARREVADRFNVVLEDEINVLQ